MWGLHEELHTGLTLGIAGARGANGRGFGDNSRAAEVGGWVNDEQVDVFSVASTGGDSYRSARQSTRYSVRELDFDAGLLRPGENVVSLRHILADRYAAGEEKGERGSSLIGSEFQNFWECICIRVTCRVIEF